MTVEELQRYEAKSVVVSAISSVFHKKSQGSDMIKTFWYYVETTSSHHPERIASSVNYISGSIMLRTWTEMM